MKELSGRTAVVTGAASGMGLAFAKRFAAAGMKVVMADIEEPALREQADELRAEGAQVHEVVLDVSSADENARLLSETVEQFGQANVVCLNAGVSILGAMQDMTPKDWDWCLGVNLHSVGYGVSTFVPHLLTHGDGHVVITASVAGHTSSPRLGIYNASKHGAVTIAETLHNELKEAGETVGVTCLCPGLVNTQILEADRNRPELMSDPGMARELTDEQEVRLALVKEVFGQAKPPEEVADLVHDAVLADQFWLFTDDEFVEPITARHQDIATRQNPSQTGSLTDVAMRDAT